MSCDTEAKLGEETSQSVKVGQAVPKREISKCKDLLWQKATVIQSLLWLRLRGQGRVVGWVEGSWAETASSFTSAQMEKCVED